MIGGSKSPWLYNKTSDTDGLAKGEREAPTYTNAFGVRKDLAFNFLKYGYVFATSVWNGFCSTNGGIIALLTSNHRRLWVPHILYPLLIVYALCIANRISVRCA
jgi:hypothetical protein